MQQPAKLWSRKRPLGSSPSLSAKRSYFNVREVAQVVAHLVWDQRVAGSSPVFPTTSSPHQHGFGLVAQLDRASAF